MKNNRSTIILLAMFLVGTILLLYPSVSDYWNSFHQSRAISSYAESVADLNQDTYREILEDARDYNRDLSRDGIMELTDEELERYNQTLTLSPGGVMSHIEIPSINCSLPIYHGTDAAVLQIAIGHIAGTSLPVGGSGTHCVLSGHRGLPSAKLFTDLDRVTEGDTFMIRTLNEVLTYEVDQILIVLPHELDSLHIEPGKDYVTLVTCTPYGINTHRLLVRGHRIETEEKRVIRVTSDAQQIEPVVVAPILAVPQLFILLIMMLVSTSRKKPTR